MEFSVIIPTFNRARFIGRAVRSVINQDCIAKSEIEAIVIDDGSTDDTEQVVKDLDPKGASIVYLKQPHCGQPGTTRNAGLNAAKGDYVAYCDSDDFWFPHHLITAKQEFRADPALAMVMTYWGWAKFRLHPEGWIENTFLVPHHPVSAVNTNCRVHKRQCIDWVGRFNESRWGEDQDFFDRITNGYRTKKVVIVTNVCGYIVGGNNLTYEFDPKIKQRFFMG